MPSLDYRRGPSRHGADNPLPQNSVTDAKVPRSFATRRDEALGHPPFLDPIPPTGTLVGRRSTA
jgi:hypothetical protein